MLHMFDTQSLMRSSPREYLALEVSVSCRSELFRTTTLETTHQSTARPFWLDALGPAQMPLDEL